MSKSNLPTKPDIHKLFALPAIFKKGSKLSTHHHVPTFISNSITFNDCKSLICISHRLHSNHTRRSPVMPQDALSTYVYIYIYTHTLNYIINITIINIKIIIQLDQINSLTPLRRRPARSQFDEPFSTTGGMRSNPGTSLPRCRERTPKPKWIRMERNREFLEKAVQSSRGRL